MIIVGQAPGRNTDPGEPLCGASGRRLAALCGIELSAFRGKFERRNVLDRWPGPAGKGDAFPFALARPVARSLAETFAGCRVVLLGRPVASLFDLDGEPLAWLAGERFDYALCPHPSGVNHWWNEPANVRRARQFWRALARTL